MFFRRQLKQPGAVIAMGMAGFLGACGGGGGGSSAVPEMTNRAPVFDQASYELTIQENTGTIVSGISFSDPDGDPITLSISGTDSEAFSVTSVCLLYTSPSPRDVEESRMPSSA